MRPILCVGVLLAAVSAALAACGTGTLATTPGPDTVQGAGTVEVVAGPSREQVRDLAWQALEPNTSSHDPANWEVIDLRRVAGGEVAGEFEGSAAYGCPGPTPVPNAPIDAAGTYWLVQFQKRAATPPAGATPLSPTAPPNVPEPFMYQAFFLVDPDDGQVVARRLLCVIY